MLNWFKLNLGDAMLASDKLAQIEELILLNCLSAPKNLIKKSLTQIPIFDLLLIFG